MVTPAPTRKLLKQVIVLILVNTVTPVSTNKQPIKTIVNGLIWMNMVMHVHSQYTPKISHRTAVGEYGNVCAQPISL